MRSMLPSPFLPVILYANVGPQGLLVVTLPALFVPQSASLWVGLHCHESPPPLLHVSAPPTSVDECFFISLVVGLPCSSISCQFWLFFVFKSLLSSFFWLCEETQCFYLCLHLGFLIQTNNFYKNICKNSQQKINKSNHPMCDKNYIM